MNRVHECVYTIQDYSFMINLIMKELIWECNQEANDARLKILSHRSSPVQIRSFPFKRAGDGVVKHERFKTVSNSSLHRFESGPAYTVEFILKSGNGAVKKYIG